MNTALSEGGSQRGPVSPAGGWGGDDWTLISGSPPNSWPEPLAGLGAPGKAFLWMRRRSELGEASRGLPAPNSLPNSRPLSTFPCGWGWGRLRQPPHRLHPQLRLCVSLSSAMSLHLSLSPSLYLKNKNSQHPRVCPLPEKPPLLPCLSLGPSREAPCTDP